MESGFLERFTTSVVQQTLICVSIRPGRLYRRLLSSIYELTLSISLKLRFIEVIKKKVPASPVSLSPNSIQSLTSLVHCESVHHAAHNYGRTPFFRLS